MRVTAIYNHKGGVAKTTTAVNLAFNLYFLGARVLIIDMDQQGNASSFYQRYDLEQPSVYEVLKGECRIQKGIYHTKYRGIDILPANSKLMQGFEEVDPERLKELLKEVADIYAYVVIDCPPAAGALINLAIAAADDVIIPVNAGTYAAEGLGTVLGILADAGADPDSAKILFTMISCRNPTQKKQIRKIIDTCNCGVYGNAIQRCIAVERSEALKKPLMKCASTSNAAQEYMDFTKEYMEG